MSNLSDERLEQARLIVKGDRELLSALREMASFQEVVGSATAHYHYPLTGSQRDRAWDCGLLSVRSPYGKSPLYRLTKLATRVLESLQGDWANG